MKKQKCEREREGAIITERKRRDGEWYIASSFGSCDSFRFHSLSLTMLINEEYLKKKVKKTETQVKREWLYCCMHI